MFKFEQIKCAISCTWTSRCSEGCIS